MGLYRLVTGFDGVQRTADEAFIPENTQLGAWNDYLAWVAAGHTADPAAAPGPDEQLSTRLNAGIAITSAGTPSLNATYAMDANTQIQITGILALLGVGQGLPNDAPTIPWPDVNGAPHSFTAVAFQDFAAAVSNYVFALRTTWAILRQGGSAQWPSQPSTIA